MKPLRLMLDVRTLGISVLILWASSLTAAVQVDEVVVDDQLDGPNVCKEVEQYQLFVTAPREVTYQERYQKWCVAVPPRCSAYRVKTKIVNETSSVTKERILKKCCTGYEKNQQGDRCIPACSNGCKHGVCIAPETCKCNEGYAGKICNINCPPNRWGSDCSQLCQCKNNSTCKAQDGSCACQKGYRGDHCEYQCPSDRFGQDCAEVCQCQNGGKCDPVSGECYCAPGFTGPLCAERCPEGKHGEQCRSDCRCQNGGSCDSQTGECICPAGYTGSVCANRCQGQRYGLRCEQKCECFNGADCNHVTGECICSPGFMGSKCLDSCPHNTYGYNCTEECRCLNGAVCDSATGKCSCSAGWMGADCRLRICPDDRFGENCTGQCECDRNNTKMCHPWTGKCHCNPGWSSTLCDRPCPFLRYGQDCLIHCNCKNNSPCNHIDGTCNCIAGYHGENCEEQCSNGTYGQNCSQSCECMNGATCAPETGQCFCAPGWQGIRCDRPCDTHRFGKDCTERCNCSNNAVCNPVNGQCTCPAGWTGERCDKKCESGRFGRNCSQTCDCSLEHTLACNATTGKCICNADWGGVRCESRCPLGYYGESCNEICTCHNNSSCDPITGDCICSSGWTGPTCNEPCPDGFFGHGCKERCPVSNTTCDHITGKYSCRPGYIGTTCEHPCPSGTYGNECKHTCTCKNGGECSHETGTCQCPPGWTGANCEEVCPNGFYGVNCNQKCNCKNKAKCRKNDGQCICDPGWMGNRCDEVCPEGFYGNHCMESCNCPTGNFACHAARGCVCSVGFYGDKCDKSRAEAKVQPTEESKYNPLPTSTIHEGANNFDTTTLYHDWKLQTEDGDLLHVDPTSTVEDFGQPLDDYIHLPDEPREHSNTRDYDFDEYSEIQHPDEPQSSSETIAILTTSSVPTVRTEGVQNTPTTPVSSIVTTVLDDSKVITSTLDSKDQEKITTVGFNWKLQSEDGDFLGIMSTQSVEDFGHPLDDYVHLPDEPQKKIQSTTPTTGMTEQYSTTMYSANSNFQGMGTTVNGEGFGYTLDDYIHLHDELRNVTASNAMFTTGATVSTTEKFDWKIPPEEDIILITESQYEGESFGHPLDDYIHLQDEPHNESETNVVPAITSTTSQRTTTERDDWKLQSEDDSFLVTESQFDGENFGHPLDDYIHLQDEPHNESESNVQPITSSAATQRTTTEQFNWKLPSEDDSFLVTESQYGGENFGHPLDDYIHLQDEPHNESESNVVPVITSTVSQRTTTEQQNWILQSEDDSFLVTEAQYGEENFGHPLDDYIHLQDEPHNESESNLIPVITSIASQRTTTEQHNWKLPSEDDSFLVTESQFGGENFGHPLDDYIHLQDEPQNESESKVIPITSSAATQRTTTEPFNWKLPSEDDSFLVTESQYGGENFGHPLDDYIHLQDEPHNESESNLTPVITSSVPQRTTTEQLNWKLQSEDDSFLATESQLGGEDFGHPLDDYIHLQDEPHNESESNFVPTTARSLSFPDKKDNSSTTVLFDWKLQSEEDRSSGIDSEANSNHLPDEPRNESDFVTNFNTTPLFDWKLQSEDDNFRPSEPSGTGEDFGHPLDDYIHLPDEPSSQSKPDSSTPKAGHDFSYLLDDPPRKPNLSKTRTTTQATDYYDQYEIPGETGNPRNDYENYIDSLTDKGGNLSANARGINGSEVAGRAFASNAGLAWGLVVAVLFVGVIVALVLYYRRRVANLKAEVNHVVNYMIQEQPGHFDNPVYSAYQNQPGAGSQGGGGSINGGQPNGVANGSLIRNNLRNPKSNLDKYRYPENESVGTDRSYSIQFLSESQKNFDADMTNPNYDVKDHVYDEIKHKDGYKDLDTEYDHLDYSRPGSSHKTHYFRMTNPLTNSPKEINVLRDNGTINNLSSPGLSSRQPLVSTGLGASAATGGATDYGSSSSNSSPIPPPLCTTTTGTDSSNLYVKMSSEGSSSHSASSDQECNNAASNSTTSKIPEHQLNIK
ncbi:uncharacterized protein LOC109409735 isoform X2 [Aedes albopictus]|uniref:Uncharacterized protein n=1 Tax=Aedes albopictus TaxID=7160 RepID=A0ABM1XUI3_AEDAL|nr:uncharacterized protein LOC109409735 isoform X2 [Aedes albopictus]